jgi:4-hydroxymandelate oxidase
VPADDELERQARQVLPPDVYAYYAAGSGDGWTVRTQERAWDEVELRPRVLRDVSAPSTETDVLGARLSTPVLVAPTATQLLANPRGELAAAEGTREAGTLYVLSMRSSLRLEEVAAVAGPFWQQVYVLRDRAVSDEVARRAAAAGARALVVTVDTPYVALKPSGFPAAMPATGLVEALDRRDRSDERLQQAADLAASDLERLAAVSGLPVVAKGVLTAAAARDCVAAGASAVVVSTHGGRQLDGVVPTPRALPEVAEAVGAQVEVYADGGVRTGRHVLKALALGARAVLLGRPVLWALATGGSDGVRDLLVGLTGQVRESLALAGCASCAAAGRDLVSHRPPDATAPGPSSSTT